VYDVGHNAGSKASLADVGLMAPSKGEGLPVEVAGLGIVGLLLQPIHFYTESEVRDRGLVLLLRQVELALLLKTRARVALAEGLVLGPFLGELLGETALRLNGPGSSGLVLRAGRRRGGNLTPLECLVKAVELREHEFAVAVVLGACGLRLRGCARVAAALPPVSDGGACCAADG
jgi:hypothetical protein